MSSFLAAPRLGGAPPVRRLPLLAAVALWSAVAVNTAVGLVDVGFPYQLHVSLLVPAAVIVWTLTRPAPVPTDLAWVAGWCGALIAALAAAVVIDAEPTFVLVVPAVAISAVLCVRRPAAAAATVFLITGSFGTLEALTPIPAGETADLVLAGLWTGVLWTYLFGQRERPQWIWPGVAFAVLYLAVTALGVVWSDPVSAGLYGFRASAWYMAAFLLLAYAPWGTEVYRRIGIGFVIVAALVGAYAVFRWIVGPAAEEEKLALSVNPEYQFLYGDLTLFGSFPGNKQLAAWTGVVIPFCVAFALTTRNRWTILAAIAAACCTIGLLGAEARGGFVAAVAGLVVVLALYQFARGVPGLHFGVTAAAAAVIIGGGAIALGTKDESALERYTVLATDPTSVPSYQARVFKWHTALDDIDQFPAGHGIGTSGMAEQRYRRFFTIASSDLDNSYLKVAYEQGVFVLALFALTLIALLVGIVRRAVFAPDPMRTGFGIAAAGALTSFAVMLFSGMFIEGLPALATWMIVGLGVAQFTSPRQDDDDRFAGRRKWGSPTLPSSDR